MHPHKNLVASTFTNNPEMEKPTTLLLEVDRILTEAIALKETLTRISTVIGVSPSPETNSADAPTANSLTILTRKIDRFVADSNVLAINIERYLGA